MPLFLPLLTAAAPLAVSYYKAYKHKHEGTGQATTTRHAKQMMTSCGNCPVAGGERCKLCPCFCLPQTPPSTTPLEGERVVVINIRGQAMHVVARRGDGPPIQPVHLLSLHRNSVAVRDKKDGEFLPKTIALLTPPSTGFNCCIYRWVLLIAWTFHRPREGYLSVK